jgi:hypothetical protein
MQVVLAAQGSNSDKNWAAFTSASRWFPIIVIFLVAILLVGLASFVVLMFLKDQYFAWSLKRGLKRNKQLAQDMKSAVI